MTVKELKEKLNKFNDDYQVLSYANNGFNDDVDVVSIKREDLASAGDFLPSGFVCIG